MRRELRPHQVTSLQRIRDSLRSGHRRPLLQLPCGGGKTLLSATIADGAVRKDKKLLFTAPALSLIPQTVREFHAEGIYDLGVIQGQHELTDWSQPIQIASVQTLMRRTMPDVDVIMVDECHVWFKFYEKMMAWAMERNIPVIGLSATPYSKGLGRHYDDLIVGATTQQLIDTGYLSNFRVFTPSHPDLSKVKTVAGEYADDSLRQVMDKPKIVADVVDTWKRLGEGRPTFCFAVDRLHAKNLCEKFHDAGVSAEYMDCFTPAEEREEVFDRFRSGVTKIICNVGILTTGIDLDVRCIILAMATKSQIKFVQILGRGLRTAPSKQDCLFLDHGDNHTRLGFVTDIGVEALDDATGKQTGPQVPQERLPKECPSCAFLRPAKLSVCPNCGHKAQAPTRSQVICEAGDLVERSRDPKKQQEFDYLARKRFYGELLTLEGWHGYKSGWAANQYRAKFNEWPNDVRDAPRAEPTAGTMAWVKHRQIAYAKSRYRMGIGR